MIWFLVTSSRKSLNGKFQYNFKELKSLMWFFEKFTLEWMAERGCIFMEGHRKREELQLLPQCSLWSLAKYCQTLLSQISWNCKAFQLICFARTSLQVEIQLETSFIGFFFEESLRKVNLIFFLATTAIKRRLLGDRFSSSIANWKFFSEWKSFFGASKKGWNFRDPTVLFVKLSTNISASLHEFTAAFSEVKFA